MTNPDFPSPPTTKWTRALIKARRFAVASLKVAVEDFLAPITDSSARLSYIGVVVSTYLAVSAGGYFRMLSELSAAKEALLPLLYATAIWLIVCIVCAPFRARKREKDLGQWEGNRFIFNEPKLVFQKQVTAADAGKPIIFQIPDAEPGGGVELRIHADVFGQPCVAHVWPVLTYGESAQPPRLEIMRNPAMSLLAVPKTKRFQLIVEKWEPSNPSVVKVYLDTLYVPQK
jgi:hypothetical protein